ncbi:hypothetical protein EMCRGX_G007285 [Ephydatia muelleri]
MQFIRSKPVLPMKVAPNSEQPENPRTSEQEGDQTSIDWDTDYIVQHAKFIGQIREKISAKAMANITLTQRTNCTMIRGMQIQRHNADLGKGVYTLYNEKTGKVLKKTVNISQLTEFHHNCPKSPEKIEQSPVVDDCASYPEKIEQSPVSLSTDLSPENNFDCWPVVDCASSPEKNEQSPVSLSTDIDAPSHMPLQDDADCSPIL